MKKIKSYPFKNCDYSQIKAIADNIKIDEKNNVFYNNINISDNTIKGILCYFKFLNNQLEKYFNYVVSKCQNCAMPKCNTQVDVIITYINEIISYCKQNNCTPDINDILYRLNEMNGKYNYLTIIMELLMSDTYCEIFEGTTNGIKNYEVKAGNLNNIVLSIINGELENPKTNESKIKVLHNNNI